MITSVIGNVLRSTSRSAPNVAVYKLNRVPMSSWQNAEALANSEYISRFESVIRDLIAREHVFAIRRAPRALTGREICGDIRIADDQHAYNVDAEIARIDHRTTTTEGCFTSDAWLLINLSEPLSTEMMMSSTLSATRSIPNLLRKHPQDAPSALNASLVEVAQREEQFAQIVSAIARRASMHETISMVVSHPYGGLCAPDLAWVQNIDPESEFVFAESHHAILDEHRRFVITQTPSRKFWHAHVLMQSRENSLRYPGIAEHMGCLGTLGLPATATFVCTPWRYEKALEKVTRRANSAEEASSSHQVSGGRIGRKAYEAFHLAHELRQHIELDAHMEGLAFGAIVYDVASPDAESLSERVQILKRHVSGAKLVAQPAGDTERLYRLSGAEAVEQAPWYVNFGAGRPFLARDVAEFGAAANIEFGSRDGMPVLESVTQTAAYKNTRPFVWSMRDAVDSHRGSTIIVSASLGAGKTVNVLYAGACEKVAAGSKVFTFDVKTGPVDHKLPHSIGASAAVVDFSYDTTALGVLDPMKMPNPDAQRTSAFEALTSLLGSTDTRTAAVSALERAMLKHDDALQPPPTSSEQLLQILGEYDPDTEEAIRASLNRTVLGKLLLPEVDSSAQIFGAADWTTIRLGGLRFPPRGSSSPSKQEREGQQIFRLTAEVVLARTTQMTEDGTIPHAIVIIDEAYILLGDDQNSNGAGAPSASFLRILERQGRSLRTNLVLLSQSPEDFLQYKNHAPVRWVGRCEDANPAEARAGAALLTGTDDATVSEAIISQLPKLPPGWGFMRDIRGNVELLRWATPAHVVNATKTSTS